MDRDIDNYPLLFKESYEALTEFLAPFVTDVRRKKIECVLTERTRQVPIVMEGLFDQGNINAVMRSAEALGFQSLHLIKKSEEFRIANRVTKGADQWLDVALWESTSSCIKQIKKLGYRIAVTDMSAVQSIDEIDFCTPTALVFGNEKEGISEEMRQLADERFKVPMVGFTQSFNISVAAAICLSRIQKMRIQKKGKHGDLEEEDLKRLRARYYLNSVAKPQELWRAFKSQQGAKLSCTPQS